MSKTQKGITSLVCAAFLFGFFGIFTKTLGYSLPLFYASWTRNLLCSVVLFFFLILIGKWIPVRKKDWIWIALRSVGGVATFAASYIVYYHLTIGTAYFVIYGVVPITGFVVGSILFKERLTVTKMIALLFSLLGLSLIYAFSIAFRDIYYLFVALIGGMGYSIWNTFSKKISDSYSVLQLNFLDSLVAFGCTFIISMLLREVWSFPKVDSAWTINLLFAGMSITTGQLIIYGFNRVEAQVGSLIMLTDIIFGIVLGYFFLHERISFLTCIGGVLIILASVLPEINMGKLQRFSKVHMRSS